MGIVSSLLLSLYGCGQAHHPHPIEEVPIGLSVPTDPTRADNQVAEGDPVGVDASAGAADDAQADTGSDPVAEADASLKKRGGGRTGKPPTAITGTSGGGAGAGGGESERARLEAKIASHEGTRQDVSALMRICAKQHDQACLRRATAALRTLPR